MGKKRHIGIIMGGYSAERHISVESGRNIFEKLASSGQYIPIPIFLTGSPSEHYLYILPLHILLKDSADDIHQKLSQPPSVLPPFTTAAQSIIQKYVGKIEKEPKPITYQELPTLVDSVFIALHGRPGEDGTLQGILEQHHLPYNGSGIATSQQTIDKFTTNRILHEHGLKVANQQLVYHTDWQEKTDKVIQSIEENFNYPFIAKPVDDGCSVAVITIKTRAMLVAYAQGIFRDGPYIAPDSGKTLQLKPHSHFPTYERFLIEELISKGDATHFLEITGGLLTHNNPKGERIYEMFEPSEVVAANDILSVEEKFLAGEGQNITPARFHADPAQNLTITEKVKNDLKKAALLLNVEGYARIDAMIKIYPHHVETWILEINTLPALTPATCIFHQCALNGYKPFDFIHAIIQYGLNKCRKENIKDSHDF